MDCVTCMLMGMCMLCGPGFGAKEPGRPMTKEEVALALENLLDIDVHTQKPTPPPRNAYNRRQTYIPDSKYTRNGIGKKNHHLDPYKFVVGIGKRKAASSNLKDILRVGGAAKRSTSDIVRFDSKHGSKDRELTEEAINNSLLSWSAMNAIPDFNPDLSKYIFNHMMERAKIAKSKQVLASERKKLQARRQRHKVDPFMAMVGIGR